jgi:hypothetical protein
MKEEGEKSCITKMMVPRIWYVFLPINLIKSASSKTIDANMQREGKTNINLKMNIKEHEADDLPKERKRKKVAKEKERPILT